MAIRLTKALSKFKKALPKCIARLVKKIMNKKTKNMTILEAKEYINKLAKEFFAIGENATEDAFRTEFAKLEKEHALWQWMTPNIYGIVILRLSKSPKTVSNPFTLA